MAYVIWGVALFFVGWKLGRKYQDLQDLLLAKRVTRIMEQGKMLAKDKEDYERWVRQDEKLAKMREEGAEA